MKKIDALELLKDLKIKVHSDPFKQIHFVDVFKALMKRIFIEREIDYNWVEIEIPGAEIWTTAP